MGVYFSDQKIEFTVCLTFISFFIELNKYVGK